MIPPPTLTFDSSLKGVPHGIPPTPLDELAALNWNILREDLQFPVAILKQSALDHNSQWMRRFLALSGALFAPHGKTTMSPQLFRRQLDDGAWGITLATVSQLQVARRFGIPRILLANQLLGDAAIRSVAAEVTADPEFDFYCLVDSAAGVERLAAAWRLLAVPRRLQVLIEVGVPGKRCGCRSPQAAFEVAQAVDRERSVLALRGVEGFEGVISSPSPEESCQQVQSFLRQLLDSARLCSQAGLFAPGAILLSAGGTQYFDLVTQVLKTFGSERAQVIVRSGCYLTHDSIVCERLHQQMLARCSEARQLGSGLRPALEVWGIVLSRPEPTRVVISMGKRDCSFDADLPTPVMWYRRGLHASPQTLNEHRTAVLHDQHAMLDCGNDSPLAVGDLVACGISHPCTTFDRWQWLPIVDDAYNLTGSIRTFF